MEKRAGVLKSSMLATATHDHKRGEDVRARLAVLSEVAVSWCQAVNRWIQATKASRTSGGDILLPSDGDIAILLQTIVGAWPLDLSVENRAQVAAYAKRIQNWQQKALREAKLATSWAAPDETYENAAHKYIDDIFSDASPILAELATFSERIAIAGAINGLGQTLVKLTVPGVPDIYQGTEYWDQSLVDPDNRSPVDFAVRNKSLKSADLVNWRRGEIKQALVKRVLAVRKTFPSLFSDGAYIPLNTSGALQDRLVCFARHLEDLAVIIVICRFNAEFATSSGSLAISSAACKYSYIHLPEKLSGPYCDAISPGKTITVGIETSIAQLLGEWPVGIFVKGC
jgi:(1->4)-alpha-D-glucan 1-alpha-D-glucosylmutase